MRYENKAPKALMIYNFKHTHPFEMTNAIFSLSLSLSYNSFIIITSIFALRVHKHRNKKKERKKTQLHPFDTVCVLPNKMDITFQRPFIYFRFVIRTQFHKCACVNNDYHMLQCSIFSVSKSFTSLNSLQIQFYSILFIACFAYFVHFDEFEIRN